MIFQASVAVHCQICALQWLFQQSFPILSAGSWQLYGRPTFVKPTPSSPGASQEQPCLLNLAPRPASPCSLTKEVGEGSGRRPEQPWVWARESKQKHQGACQIDTQESCKPSRCRAAGKAALILLHACSPTDQLWPPQSFYHTMKQRLGGRGYLGCIRIQVLQIDELFSTHCVPFMSSYGICMPSFTPSSVDTAGKSQQSKKGNTIRTHWSLVFRPCFGKKKSFLEHVHLFPLIAIAISKYEMSIYERLYTFTRGQMDERWSKWDFSDVHCPNYSE